MHQTAGDCGRWGWHMSARLRDMSILYVEDDDAIREHMSDFLNRRFEQVLMAENGAEGLDVYHRKVPDIVMTDLKMPVMDGLEMTRAILEENDKAAIIVTSAHNETKYLLGAIELGISQYLLKPLEREKLDASLQHCIEIVRKARMQHEREKYISAAYQSMNSLIDYGEENFNSTPDHVVELDWPLDRVVENILGGGNSASANCPENLIMTMTHGLAGQPEWLWFEMGHGKPVQRACYFDHPELDLNALVGNHTLYYVNEGDPLPDDPFLGSFVEHFSRHGEQLKNLVWYRNGFRIICTMNYPDQVTSCDAAMVKNMAVQTRYIDTISAQRHQTEEAFQYTIISLARAAEANDEDTGNHILRVGEFCAAFCRHIGYPDELANIISLQSQLHDVGKIHIPPEILKKPGKLTDAELALVREHPLFGAKIIGNHPRLEIARTIALYHHERWDGSGYPFGLSQTSIPLDARIAALADTYDALRNKRIYKPAFDHFTAYRIIVEGDGRTEPTHFDPELLRIYKNIDRELEEVYERFTPPK